MKNYYWYLLLVIVSVLVFTYVLVKKKDIKLVGLYFFIAGITYTLEYVILIYLNSYQYFLGLLKEDIYDSIIGSFASNAFIIPTASTVVAAFKLKLRGQLLIISIILGIEALFVYLDIYKHFWWNYFYTAVGLVIVFYIAKKWNSLLHNSITTLVRGSTIFFSNITIQATLGFSLSTSLDLYVFNVNWFESEQRNNMAFFGTYLYLISLFLVIIIVKKPKIYFALAMLLILSVVDFILLNLNILHLYKGFSLFYIFMVRVMLLVIFKLFDKYILGEN